MALTTSTPTSKPRIATLASSKVRDAGATVSKNNSSSDEADSSSSADRNTITITVAVPAASSVTTKGVDRAREDKYDKLANELGETKRRLDEMREQFDDERDTTTDLLEYHENVTRQLKETNQKLGKTIKELNAEKKVNKDLLSRVEQSEKVQADLIARLEKLERAQRAEGVVLPAVEHHQDRPQAARGHQLARRPHEEDYEGDAPGGRHAKRLGRAEGTLCRHDDKEGRGEASRYGAARAHGSTARAQDPSQPTTSSVTSFQQEMNELQQRLQAVIDAGVKAGGGSPYPCQSPAQAAAEIERDKPMSIAEHIAEAKDLSRRLEVVIAIGEAALQDPQLPTTPDGRDTLALVTERQQGQLRAA